MHEHEIVCLLSVERSVCDEVGMGSRVFFFSYYLFNKSSADIIIVIIILLQPSGVSERD